MSEGTPLSAQPTPPRAQGSSGQPAPPLPADEQLRVYHTLNRVSVQECELLEQLMGPVTSAEDAAGDASPDPGAPQQSVCQLVRTCNEGAVSLMTPGTSHHALAAAGQLLQKAESWLAANKPACRAADDEGWLQAAAQQLQQDADEAADAQQVDQLEQQGVAASGSVSEVQAACGEADEAAGEGRLQQAAACNPLELALAQQGLSWEDYLQLAALTASNRWATGLVAGCQA
jgi:hypothetical protein